MKKSANHVDIKRIAPTKLATINLIMSNKWNVHTFLIQQKRQYLLNYYNYSINKGFHIERASIHIDLVQLVPEKTSSNFNIGYNIFSWNVEDLKFNILSIKVFQTTFKSVYICAPL